MPINDLFGFAAILGAGFWAGYNYAPGQTFSAMDVLLIVILMAIGFFFSVVLS